MKIIAVAAGVLVVIAVVAFAAYRFVPRAFVTAGRGVVSDPSVLSVTRVATAASTLDFNGQQVQAGTGKKYVLIDCVINAPADRIDFDDFQLVKSRAATLGDEENIGDNVDENYFYWSFLDTSGGPVSEVPKAQNPVRARIAFKVPGDSATGYLFSWGLYWGPLEFKD